MGGTLVGDGGAVGEGMGVGVSVAVGTGVSVGVGGGVGVSVGVGSGVLVGGVVGVAASKTDCVSWQDSKTKQLSPIKKNQRPLQCVVFIVLLHFIQEIALT